MYGRLRVHRDSCRCHPRVGGTSWPPPPTDGRQRLGRVNQRSFGAHSSLPWLYAVDPVIVPPTWLTLFKRNNNNNLRLIMVKTNRSTLHTVYNTQQSATQGSNDTTQTVTQDSSNNQV